MSSAMIEEPPSPAKLALIRRFLIANGTQAEIDNGRFLHRFAVPGSLLFEIMAGGPIETNLRQAFDLPMEALMRAYEKKRSTWQDEHERHVNWEFEADELLLIVSFVASAADQHFLEGRRRIGAYVGTNTEHLVDQIIAEAQVDLKKRALERSTD